MDNEDVGGAGESIALILTYFMIMKGIQRMIMIKVGSPTDVPAQLCSYCRQSAAGTQWKDHTESKERIQDYIKRIADGFAANRMLVALHVTLHDERYYEGRAFSLECPYPNPFDLILSAFAP